MSARKGNKRTDQAKIVMKTVATMKEEIKRLSGVNKEMLDALELLYGAFDNGKERRHLRDVFSGKCEDVCQPCAQKKALEIIRKAKGGA